MWGIHTQQPAECGSYGPAVASRRRGVGRQKVIAGSDYLTQTEYLEETGLRAEARGHASERGCSHPLDVEPCAIGYTNILSHMLLRRGVRLAAIVFCF